MKIEENVSLKPFNTFGIDAKARYFSAFRSESELEEILLSEPVKQSMWILGGGSNILLTGNIDGWVLKNEIKGKEVLTEDENYVYVKAGAGENWHAFVLYCLQHNFAGVENLSLIPGNVGASPMQNIGAYGVEIKDVFYDLEAYNIDENKCYTFSLNDCEFGYRDSIFKNKYKDSFVILSVTLRLRKKPVFHTQYGAIEEELQKMGIQELSIQAISQAVINIRKAKLPDPSDVGNAGSFFKNPSVSQEVFLKIKETFPNVIAYPNKDGTVKLAAGWMIEQCGWKGVRKGDAGCHPKQALVLVNYGNATGKEIYSLSQEILDSVNEKFGVKLEREVNVI